MLKMKRLLAFVSLFTGLFAMLFVGLSLDPAEARGPYNKNYKRQQHVAGKFDYYAMVLSWSPSYCERVGNRRRDPQCTTRGRGYSFILHGLWPQYEKRWPQNCRTKERPYVSNAIIRSMMDIMPSKGLIIHEYKKHGTCSGYGPKGYYELSRRLFNKIKIPTRYQNVSKALFVSPEQLTQDFVVANPGLKPSHFAISCRGSGNRLREIRFCFARNGKLRNCGRNENRRRMCSAKKVYMPPVRIPR